MRGAIASTLLVMLAGCRGGLGKDRVTRVEPSLSGTIDDGGAVAVAPTPAPDRTIGYVDRHPLLSKPREYWDSSGDNKIVKAAAATFIGVPVGFVGEMKQIVVGTPAETHY
jgi:hypothetical protein